MTIQWYPGHMHKAQKDIRQALSKVDIVVEVIDARIPFSSANPLINNLIGGKARIKVLSKSDLVSTKDVYGWQRYLEKQHNLHTLPISIENTAKIKTIPDLCKKILPHKAQGFQKIRAMILGIPNVGKSTLINILAGRSIAKTGNEPAVTKSQQFIHINDDFLLLDTPGILWPKQQYENCSYRLAATGAIKDTALDYTDVAFFTVGFLMQRYPACLLSRYSLDQLPPTESDFFEVVGRQRGCLVSGGRVDLTKISELFIKEFRAGLVGKVCMESPEIIAREIAEENEIRLQREAKKEAKKNRTRKGS